MDVIPNNVKHSVFSKLNMGTWSLLNIFYDGTVDQKIIVKRFTKIRVDL